VTTVTGYLSVTFYDSLSISNLV